LGAEHEFQPDLVAAQQVEGQVAQPGGLAAADAILDAGAAAMAQLQGGQVGVGLVGDEHLEAVPVGVAERQLGARVRILAAADRPGARRPAGKVQGGHSATSASGRGWPLARWLAARRLRARRGPRRGRVRRLAG